MFQIKGIRNLIPIGFFVDIEVFMYIIVQLILHNIFGLFVACCAKQKLNLIFCKENKGLFFKRSSNWKIESPYVIVVHFLHVRENRQLNYCNGVMPIVQLRQAGVRSFS